MIPGTPFLPRIAAAALLAVHSLAAYEWGGRVMDDVGRPLAGPRICWLSDTSLCVIGNDSGEFRIDLPLGHSTIGKSANAPGLRVEFVRGTIILHAPHASVVSLDWFTPKGRRLRNSVLSMKPDGVDALQGSNWPEASGSLVLLRVSGANTSLIVKIMLLGSRPRFLPRPPVLSQPPIATPLAKAAAVLGPYVVVAKPGYRKAEFRLFDDAGLNTITMSVADDSGYFRENEVRFDVDSIDTVANRIHIRRSDAHCEGNQLVPENTSGNFWYGLAEGKLYLRMEAECQGMRLGGSSSLLGDWSLEDRAEELPPSLRPGTCPAPLPGSRPLDSSSTGGIRIRSQEMVWWSFAEQCPGAELYYKVRNHFRTDPEVKMTGSKCRYTEFNKAQTTARVEYVPFGTRESTMVTFTYQGKRCSYVDPLASDDPPKQCPDPSEMAYGEFLACIDSSGFAKPAGSVPKRFAMEKPALPARNRTIPIFGELLRYLSR